MAGKLDMTQEEILFLTNTQYASLICVSIQIHNETIEYGTVTNVYWRHLLATIINAK